MQKLLEILGDCFLFIFFLLIVLLPVIVSFNLDPQLYQVESKIAGVSDFIGGQNSLFSFKLKDKNAVDSFDEEVNRYTARLVLDSLDDREQSFTLGTLTNESSKSVKINVEILLQGESDNMRIYLQTGDKRSLLLGKGNSSKTDFMLKKNAEAHLELISFSKVPIHYQVPLLVRVWANNS